MAILRTFNALGNMRLDVSHLRSIESAIAGDFDVIVGRSMAGNKGMVVKGFALSNTSVGTVSSEIQLLTADSIAYNVNASESGSFLWIPSDRAPETLSSSNSNVIGSFTSSSVNYIGIDFKRSSDASTADLVQFIDSTTLRENSRSVALGRTLNYVIHISTAPFSVSSNIIPVAKVTTDSFNKVSSVQDARSMMFRLGAGGDSPNSQSSFSFPFGRQENVVNNTFSGGDKNIQSQKDWMDAMMTRLWELGGGENWYSPTADRNARMTRNQSSTFASTGDNFEWVAGLYSVNHLHWKGLRIIFDNANSGGVYYNTISDQLIDDVGVPATSTGSKTSLAVGECIYVDVDRTSNATIVALKSSLQNLGAPIIPGSRYVLAWRTSDGVFSRDATFQVNIPLQAPATTVADGSVRLAYAAGDPSFPTVTPLNSNNAIQIGGGSYPILSNATALTVTGVGTSPSVVVTSVESSGLSVVCNGIQFGYTAITGVGNNPTEPYEQGGTGGSFTGGNGTAFDAAGGAGAVAVGGNGVGTELGGSGLMAFAGSNGAGTDAWKNNAISGFGTSSGTGVYGVGGGVGGAGVYGAGGSLSSNITRLSTSLQKAEYAVGGWFVGGGGTYGGDGIQTFAKATGTPRSGISAWGNTTTAAGIAGGRGGYFVGGTNTAGSGNADGGSGIEASGGAKRTGGSGVDGYGGILSGGGTDGGGALTYGFGTGHGVDSSAFGTGAAFKSSQGDFVIGSNTNKLKFESSNTGVTVVGAAKWIDDNSGTNSGAAFTAISGSNGPFWQGVVDGAIGCNFDLPRGATITAVDLFIKNEDVSNRDIQFSIESDLYTGSGYTKTVVCDKTGVNAFTTNSGTTTWYSMTPITAVVGPTGRTGSNNSGTFSAYIVFPTTTIKFYAMRVTYSYTEVDFHT